MNIERYKRQIQLPEVGIIGQEKLQASKVLVVGAGGLSCAVLPYLVSSGVGTIGILDGDTIQESNLHRQILYTKNDIGRYKAKVAKAYLEQLNSDVTIHSYTEYLTGYNALDLFKNYDIIVDATDNIVSRYLINDACVVSGIPFVYASVFKFEGQVAVFNYNDGPTYRCLFKNESEVQNCDSSGVLPTTVGTIGMLQANEVLKLILETGELLLGKLLVYNTLKNSQHHFKFSKDKAIKIGLDFFEQRHMKASKDAISISQVSIENTILLDVREHDELPKLEIQHHMQIPLSILKENTNQLDKSKLYAVYCQSGKRSEKAVSILKKQKFKHVKHVKDDIFTIKKQLTDEEHIF